MLSYFCLVDSFKKLLNFYIQSSMHVALSAVALVCLSVILLNLSSSWILLGFIFTATITGYNFVLYAGIAKWHHQSLPPNLRLIQLFSLLSFLAMLYFLWQLPIALWGWIALTGIMTLFYAVPVLPNGKNLRNTPGVKIGIIALVWALTTVIFPAINSGLWYSETLLLLFLQRFLFVFVLILPFEIRDLTSDAISLETIPQRLGVRNTKILGVVILTVIVVLEFFIQQATSVHQVSYIIFGLTGVLLCLSNPCRSRYYTALLVEAIPMIWLLFELL